MQAFVLTVQTIQIHLTHLGNQAVESLKKVAGQLSGEHLLRDFVPLIRRLSGGDWFTSRMSACCLFAVSYAHVPPTSQEELRVLFAQLCRDDTPMVRACALQHASGAGLSLPHPL